MKVREQRRNNILVLLLVLLCSLGLGYALLRTNLTINGTSKIKGNTWDIHFENLNVTDGSVLLSDGDSAATIQSGATNVSYTITLNTPGDYYEFTVDAVNAGSIDGMVESVTSKLNDTVITTLPAYLDYSVSYSDGRTIEKNHLLRAGESNSYKVRIEFKKDITESDLPTTEQTFKLDFAISFIQADENAIMVYHPLNGFFYTINRSTEGYVYLNQSFSRITFYSKFEEALNDIEIYFHKSVPFCLKHRVKNGIVTQQFIEFIVTESMAEQFTGMVPGIYDLRGEKTFENGSYTVGENYISLYYESNKEVLKKAFGYASNSSRCSESGTGRSSYFYCSVSSLNVHVYANGEIHMVNSSESDCRVNKDGTAYFSWI